MKLFKFFTAIFICLFSFNATAQNAGGFILRSNNIIEGSTISAKHVYNGFGCAGKNLSPHLSWKDAPQGTRSFALTVYDPDAPTGSGWWHWLLINIPANYDSLPQNFGERNQFNLSDGINQVRNDFGAFNFGGPCPPKGDKPHRYIFTIHALKVEQLSLAADSTAALAGYMINQSTIAKTSFVAYFAR